MKLAKIILIITTIIILTICHNPQQPHRTSTPHSPNSNSHTLFFQQTSQLSLPLKLSGFILGPILFILSLIIIFLTQKKAAIQDHRTDYIMSNINQINGYNQEEVREAEGKLVYVTGKMVTQDGGKLGDGDAGVEVDGVVKLERLVEVREVRVHGSGKNGKSEIVWANTHQPFPGQNLSNSPQPWFITSKTTTAKTVSLANYTLPESLKQLLSCTQQLIPTTEHATNLAKKFKDVIKNQPVVQDGYIYFPSQVGQLENVGTLRVKYRCCRDGEATVVAQASGHTFVPFRISSPADDSDEDFDVQFANPNKSVCSRLCTCTPQLLTPVTHLNLITQSKHPLEYHLQTSQTSQKCRRYLLRLCSYFLMVFSVCLFLSPVTYILGYVPLIGEKLSVVVEVAVLVAGVVLCLPVFLVWVGGCWLGFRVGVGGIRDGGVLVGIGVVVGVAVGIGIYLNRGKGSAGQEAVQTVKHLFYSLRSYAQQQ